MVVKKVQTNKAAAPRSRARHVRDLCDYIAGPAAAAHEHEKVEHRGAVNLLNIDHDAQVQEMADLAETARRSPQPVQHWILSWRQGEHPTASQADDAARTFLREMGLAEHQCVYALHRNTDNFHLHLAVNRVHPETERVVTVNGGFDLEVAHRAIARIERAQGWQREARGRYQALDGGELRRVEPPGPAQPQPRTRARDLENRTGQRSAQRVAIEDAAELIRRARHWNELHASLAEQGMRFERKGSGAILWVGEVAVKASVAGRDCGMPALEKRLGPFLPPPDLARERPRVPEPIDSGVTAWREYATQRHAFNAARRQERALLRKQHQARRVDLLERHLAERREILGGDWRGRGAALSALRSLLAARQAQEKAAQRERSTAELAACRERFPRRLDFEAWLRERRGPEQAQQWRLRDRMPPRIVGDRDDPARARDIRAFAAQVDGWQVRYHRAGATRGGPAFTDRGREIRIHDLGGDSVLAALQLSAQKWGTFHVDGSDAYKRLCVELAATHGFRITNPELQAPLLALKERQVTLPPLARGRPGVER